jgi:hypothetical protein
MKTIERAKIKRRKMTRGNTRGPTRPIPRGVVKGATLPPEIEFGEAWVRVTQSPLPNQARVTWDLGGRSTGWLQSSTDLQNWDEAGILGPSGFFDEPLAPERKSFRIRLETNS